jgi:GTP-binding protein EngB required for normal cell division
LHPFLVQPEHLALLERIRAALERLRVLSRAVGGDDESDRTLTEVLRHLDELFMVVVVGEVKSGKSTLINALIGSEVCAMGPTPVTDRITILKYGEESTPMGGENSVREHALPVPELRGLAVVDTPGTNSLVGWHGELTEGFLPRADLVLFVTSCDRPYSASENDFLHLIRDRWRRKIVFILTKTDIKEPGEIGEIVDYVRRCAKEELGLSPTILLISPREAFRARLENDEKRLELSGYPALRELIMNALDDEQKAHLRLCGPVDAGLVLTRGLRERVRRTRDTLESDFRNLRDLRDQTDMKRRDLGRLVTEAGDRLVEVFAALRLRGEGFMRRQFRLSKFASLLVRSRVEARFRKSVIGDLDDRATAAMEEGMMSVVVAARHWFRDTSDYFARALAQSPHRDRVSGGPATGLEMERESILEGVRKRCSEHLRSFDSSARAREVLDATKRDVGVSAAGVGAGVLSTALLGVLASLWWTAVLVPVAGAGLAFLKLKRGRMIRGWSERVGALEARCRETLGAEMEQTLDEARTQVRRIYRPYLAFYESEVGQVEVLEKDMNSALEDLENIRNEIRG